MTETTGWYGNWGAVVLSILAASFIFAVFFWKPKKLNWRSFGLTEAFIISLFTEMFGIPLTIYLISSLLKVEIVPSDLTGHLWATMLAISGILDLEVGVMLVMATSVIIIAAGAILLVGGWIQVYEHRNSLITVGLYALVRHPQYLGIMLIMTGFIVQWPTIPTMVMYPVLLYLYHGQALREESQLTSKFGGLYAKYASKTPRFNLFKRLLSTPWDRRNRQDLSSKTD